MDGSTLYLDRIKSLNSRYPALRQFLRDWGRFDAVNLLPRSSSLPQRPWGRVGVLEFMPGQTPRFKDLGGNLTALREYVAAVIRPHAAACQHRLFLLEDLDPDYVQILGTALRIDPVVLANHLDSYHFTDNATIPHRTLPSSADPATSFTLRYYELIEILAEQPLTDLRRNSRRTFARASRQIESWTDTPKSRIDVIRRNLSFWCDETSEGWNAILFVDPPISVQPVTDDKNNSHQNHKDYQVLMKVSNNTWTRQIQSSCPYHLGYADIRSWRSDQTSTGPGRTSLFDDIIFYWHRASQEEINSALVQGVDSAIFATQVVAAQWLNLLDLQLNTLSVMELRSRKQAGRSMGRFDGGEEWRQEIIDLSNKSSQLNVLRARLMWYEGEMLLNLERLGIGPDGSLNDGLRSSSPSTTLLAAKRNFYAIFTQLQLHKSRADNLTGIVTDIINLRGAMRALNDGHVGLQLSVVAAIFFPLTLVAAIFSMGSDYSPGARDFWVPWVVAVPLILLLIFLVWRTRRMSSI